MNYYEDIKNRLIDNEIYSKVKDYSKERNKVITYYEVGRILSEAGKHYGEDIIGKYADKLKEEVNKKYNKTTLFRMRQLYYTFNNKKVAPVVQQLSWSQCLLLIPLKDENKINYYINQVLKRNLSKRQLQEIIKNKEYERLDEETKKKLVSNNKVSVTDLVKNPILIKNKYNTDDISEKVLQRIILEDIESFMKELGNGYSFIGSEYQIKMGNRYNYIDLLLFNYEYNCFVVIELKVTELKKEHIGQIEIYMNYIDTNLRSINQNNTIGIIICRKDNKYVIEYCSDYRVISREYELV